MGVLRFGLRIVMFLPNWIPEFSFNFV